LSESKLAAPIPALERLNRYALFYSFIVLIS